MIKRISHYKALVQYGIIIFYVLYKLNIMVKKLFNIKKTLGISFSLRATEPVSLWVMSQQTKGIYFRNFFKHNNPLIFAKQKTVS